MWSKMPVFNGWKLVKSIKIGNATGIDNIPSEAIQAGGGVSIEALYKLINEVWRLTKTPLSKVQTFVNRRLHQILGIFWANVITNEELWQDLDRKMLQSQ